MSQIPPPADPLSYQSYVPPQKARPTSVMVIAIFGFILGGLAVLGNLCGLPQQLGVNLTPNPVMDAVRKDTFLQSYLVGSMVLNLIIAIWALWASVGILSLKKSARASIIYYAIIYLVLNVFGIVMGLLVINPRMAQITQNAMAGNPALNTPLMKNIMQSSQYLGVCLGVVLLAWPLSILYVMSRPHVKAAFERGMPPQN